MICTLSMLSWLPPGHSQRSRTSDASWTSMEMVSCSSRQNREWLWVSDYKQLEKEIQVAVWGWLASIFETPSWPPVSGLSHIPCRGKANPTVHACKYHGSSDSNNWLPPVPPESFHNTSFVTLWLPVQIALLLYCVLLQAQLLCWWSFSSGWVMFY